MDQHACARRVGDDVLVNAVAAFTIVRDDTVTERAVFEAADLVVEIALFLMEKRLPVGYEELQIANLRPVDGRKIDFVEDAV
jgi:hypothetical protein